MDAVSISGYYTMVAMLLNTARTPLAPGVPAPLPGFSVKPPRVVRTEAPVADLIMPPRPHGSS